jgi:DNA-binding transcriptional LysR family regulator
MASELEGMETFLAVAEAKGFRAAADRLGLTGSAVSKAVRALEERLGVVLVQRTTRSVRLTAAGERLYATLRPALAEVRATVAALGEEGDTPRGTLRLSIADSATHFLNGPLLAGFLAAHPHVDLDVAVSDTPVDIVASGYDAGLRLGEVIDKDMIAVPVSGDLRLVVVGSPAYLARRGRPAHPRDLAAHDAINWHPTPDAPPYRWEFTDPEDGREFSVAVRARLLTTDPVIQLGLARAGAGLTILFEAQARDDVARGDLEPVLEAFCRPFAGYYLYYPQRRQASPALRALVDYLRAARRDTTGRRTEARDDGGRAKVPRGRRGGAGR